MGATGAAACAAAGAATGAALAPWAARLVIAGPDRGRALTAAWAAARPSRRLQLGAGAATGTGGALGAAAAGWAPDLPAFLLLGVLGGLLAVIDIRTHRLPNRLVLMLGAGVSALLGAATLLGAAAGPSGFELADLLRALLCGAVGFAVLGALALISPAGLGLGDAKLFGALSIALGWRAAGAVFWGGAAAFALGAVAALALLVARRATLRSALAFGPSLVLGALVVLVLWPP